EADLVVGDAHRLQRRVGSRPGLQPRANRRRACTGQLQEGGRTEPLREGQIEAVLGPRVVVEPDERLESAEGGSAARVLASGPRRAFVADAVANPIPPQGGGQV